MVMNSSNNNNSISRNEALLRYDKTLFIILMAHLPITMFLVPMGYGTMDFAIVSSLMVAAIAGVGYWLLRGTPAYGILAGVLLMSFSAIMIQSQLGRIEMHFHVFGALALLLIYRNWLPIVVAAGVIAVHHLALTWLQLNEVSLGDMPLMVFNYGCSWGITFLHAAFVVFESAALIYYAIIMKRDEVIAQRLVEAVSLAHQNKDLSLRISGEQNAVAIAFNAMMDQFSLLTKDVADASHQIMHEAQLMGGNVHSAESEITMQHSQTEQVASAIEEMNQSIHEVASNTQRAADVAEQSNSQVEQGFKLFNQAENATQELKNTMSEASESIQLLESNAANIGSVVDVIQGISEQTNLLALNAAIEAARAGEQGRGFAVVADEVRTLAQRTQESTHEIQVIIEKLQTDTQSSVSKISHGQKMSEETNVGVQKAGNMLQDILRSVADIRGMNGQIAQASDEQSRVAEFISKNIAKISTASNNIVMNSDENVRAVDNLAAVSKRLNEMISGYNY